MTEIKISWEEFLDAALDSLAHRFPGQVALNKPQNIAFYRTYEYEGDCIHYDFPTYVLIKVIE